MLTPRTEVPSAIEVANEAIAWVRSRVSSANDPRDPGFHERLRSIDKVRKETRDLSRWLESALDEGVGNCAEMTQLAVLYIERNYPGRFNLQTRSLKEADHAYLVLEEAESPTQKVLCDPWGGMAGDWSERVHLFQQLEASLVSAASSYVSACKRMFDQIISEIQADSSGRAHSDRYGIMCRVLHYMATEIQSIGSEYCRTMLSALNRPKKVGNKKKLTEAEQLKQFHAWSKKSAEDNGQTEVDHFDHLGALYVKALHLHPEAAEPSSFPDEGYDMILNSDIILLHSTIAKRFDQDGREEVPLFAPIHSQPTVIMRNAAEEFKQQLLQLRGQYVKKLWSEKHPSAIRMDQISAFEVMVQQVETRGLTNSTQMNRTIQKLEQIRDQFVATVKHSHETQTKNKCLAFFRIHTSSRLAKVAESIKTK